MIGYIYFLINKVNGKRYVGQTKFFSQRKSHHIRELKNGMHHNKKLQSAWNKYGEDNFYFEVITFPDITQEELNKKEILFIQKYNSIEQGYNIMKGGGQGEGNNSRGKISYEQYCFIYFGNKKYQGMTTRTGKYLGIDSSTVSAIKNEKSYKWYLDKALKEPQAQKEKYLAEFEQKMRIKEEPPFILQKTLSSEDTLDIMCFVSTYGRGAEKVCLDHFSLSKGFVFHIIDGTGRKEIKDTYNKMSQEEIIAIGEKCYMKWQVEIPLKKQYKNLHEKYPNHNF